MILKSMTDFVLERNFLEPKYNAVQHRKYAHFLKQPLTLGMFVPCDENGNPLEEPLHYRSFIDYENDMDDDLPIDVLNVCGEYHEAKKRILFEGFKFDGYNVILPDGQFMQTHKLKNLIAEDIISYNLTLTPNAIKQL